MSQSGNDRHMNVNVRDKCLALFLLKFGRCQLLKKAQSLSVCLFL